MFAYSFVVPFTILWLGVYCILYRRMAIGTAFAVFSISGFFYVNQINTQAIIPIGLLSALSYATIYLYNKQNILLRRYVYKLTFTVTIILSYVVATHVFSGFSNPIIASNIVLSDNAPSFSLYWNIDKTFVAFCLMLIYVSVTKQAPIKPSTLLRNGTLSAALVVVVTLSIAWSTGLVRWEPKLPEIFVWWFMGNLFITCTAEEVFFRGIIQNQIERSLTTHTKYAGLIALTTASLFFGLAHFAQGPLYIMVAIIAGCGYGLVYRVTKRLEAAILTHFLVNTVHFLVFSYPMYLAPIE